MQRKKITAEERELRTRYNREWRARNPDKVAAWAPKNRERAREYHRKRRLDVIQAYGGECACCGEDEPKFLTIDHVNGLPDHHKRNGKRKPSNEITQMLWKALPELDPEIQVLCFNCNSGRQINSGVCPHKGGDAHV